MSMSDGGEEQGFEVKFPDIAMHFSVQPGTQGTKELVVSVTVDSFAPYVGFMSYPLSIDVQGKAMKINLDVLKFYLQVVVAKIGRLRLNKSDASSPQPDDVEEITFSVEEDLFLPRLQFTLCRVAPTLHDIYGRQWSL